MGDHFGGAGGAGFGGINPEDILNNLFGGGFSGAGFGGNRQTRAPQPRRGDDVRTHITLDFMEAVEGCEKTISIRTKDSCSSCSGTGVKKGSTPKTCTTCNGSGVITQKQGFFHMQSTCPSCNGTGQTVDVCPSCSGSMFTSSVKQITVNIPAGVDNGSNVRMREKGDAGQVNGPRGDLYIQCHVRPNNKFRRDGANVHVNVPISFHIAALGGKVKIPTLKGDVLLKVDPGTQPGDKRRMSRKGIKRLSSGGFGDQFVHFKVQIPKHLTEKQRQLLEELAKEFKNTPHPEEKGFFSKFKRIFY